MLSLFLGHKNIWQPPQALLQCRLVGRQQWLFVLKTNSLHRLPGHSALYHQQAMLIKCFYDQDFLCCMTSIGKEVKYSKDWRPNDALRVLARLKVVPLSSNILRRAIKLLGSSLINWCLHFSCFPDVIIQGNNTNGKISEKSYFKMIALLRTAYREKQLYGMGFPGGKPEWETLLAVTFGLYLG